MRSKSPSSSSSRRTLRLTAAYDGSRYHGWQRQAVRGRSSRTPTVQETIEAVLRKILQEPVAVIGSGRTDAGVHAIAQVAHVKTRSLLSCARLRRSLNQLLPQDIAVTAVEEARPDFHARFGARRKRYRYRIFIGAVAPPFIRPYVYHAPFGLSLRAMRRELSAIRGRRDFQAFARSSGAGRRTVRTITGASLARRGDELHLELEGSGFLHTMARSIAGTLIDVGRGRLPAGTVRRMVRTGDRRLAGTTAPPQGLCLMAVDYAPTRS